MTIGIRIKSWKESPNISPELAKTFDGMQITINNTGAWISDNKTGRTDGPYPGLQALSSKGIADYFSLRPKDILAWILCLSSGVERLRLDEATRIVEDHKRKRLAKAKQEIWGVSR